MDSHKKILRTLKQLYWDYDFEPEQIYDVLCNKREGYYHLTKENIFIRMLERLNWYDILDIIDIDVITKLLTKEVISKLRSKILQKRYERLRKILHNETIPNDGWDFEYIKSLRTSILSNRWYSSL